MLLPLALPMTAHAEEPVEPSGSQSVPNIIVGGDGDIIYTPDGTPVYKFDALLLKAAKGTNDADDGESTLKESLMNILKSFILGVATGNYDEYYDKLQAEIGELTEKLQMDENGDPQYGTDISQKKYDINRKNTTTSNLSSKYKFDKYQFWYDWRKSPLEIADELDEYIEGICAVTGHEQVTLTGRCLGSNFALAYLMKYGYKNRIKGFGFQAGMQYGQDPLSEAISGKVKTDGDAINRYITDMEDVQGANLDDWIKEVIDFAEHAELLNGLSIATRATIYDKVVEGVTSAIALSTYCTIPAYWSCVNLRDYDDALKYVFGKKGSEKRQKYAGLIEKIEAYHDQVQVNIESLLKDFSANGGNICVISKYGFQMTPVCESRNLVSDDMVSVRNSAMGATTSKLYNTLKDSYIEQREAEGKGKYISPDRKVDASTALFPDYTWFLKGAGHARWTAYENNILYTVMAADRQLTVEDLTVTRFGAAEKDSNGTYICYPMTADNCHTENWEYEKPKEEQTKFNRLFRFVQSLLSVLKLLINYLQGNLGE